MNEFEKRLKDMGLACPSADLDHRMGKILGDASLAPRLSHNLDLTWFMRALAASGMAAALLLVALSSRHRVPKVVIYRIEAKGSLRQLLLDPPSTVDNRPRFKVDVSAP
jgi:hypothetical protein